MMREGGFPAPDEALDAVGLAKAQKRLSLWSATDYMGGPEQAVLQTAEAFGAALTVDPALRDMDHGAWVGRRFAKLMADEPSAFQRWIGDPASGAPGGESFAELCARVGGWLDVQASAGASRSAIAAPSVIRAAIAMAIAVPAEAALRIDIAPLSITTLSFNRGWRLQAIVPA